MSDLSSAQRNLRSTAVDTATTINVIIASAMVHLPETYEETLRIAASNLLQAVGDVNYELDRGAFGDPAADLDEPPESRGGPR